MLIEVMPLVNRAYVTDLIVNNKKGNWFVSISGYMANKVYMERTKQEEVDIFLVFELIYSILAHNNYNICVWRTRNKIVVLKEQGYY